MTKTYSEVVKLLDADISPSVISKREAFKGGPKLSYLEGWYVIDRLNQLLGQGNWHYSVGTLDKVFEGKTEKGQFTVSYVTTVSFTAYLPAEDGAKGFKTVTFTEVGYGDGIDGKSPGKAHELASKESVTDALKRCAKNLGRSMGLALYDKTGEFISDGVDEAVGEIGANPSAVKMTKEQALAMITATSKAIIAQKKHSAEQLKGMMATTYKVSKKEELSEEEAISFAGFLKEVLNSKGGSSANGHA